MAAIVRLSLLLFMTSSGLKFAVPWRQLAHDNHGRKKGNCLYIMTENISVATQDNFTPNARCADKTTKKWRFSKYSQRLLHTGCRAIPAWIRNGCVRVRGHAMVAGIAQARCF
jgi:hypothetical protein